MPRGRPKGSKNKISAEAKVIFQKLLDKMAPEAEAWLRECAQGIEIEKTNEDGTTVIGRFNADPGKAIDLLLKMSEFYFPKLARVEKGLADVTDDELLAEVRKRALDQPQALQEAVPDDPVIQ